MRYDYGDDILILIQLVSKKYADTRVSLESLTVKSMAQRNLNHKARSVRALKTFDLVYHSKCMIFTFSGGGGNNRITGWEFPVNSTCPLHK